MPHGLGLATVTIPTAFFPHCDQRPHVRNRKPRSEAV